MMMAKIKEANRLPRYAAIVFFFLAIAVYSLFQARFLIIGPRVSVTTPRDGSIADTDVVTMQGVAKNAAWLSLNGRQIFTDEDGNWSEKLVISEGQSVMTVQAKDRFGRETEKKVRIYLN